jgi:hypothetical protein
MKFRHNSRQIGMVNKRKECMNGLLKVSRGSNYRHPAKNVMIHIWISIDSDYRNMRCLFERFSGKYLAHRDRKQLEACVFFQSGFGDYCDKFPELYGRSETSTGVWNFCDSLAQAFIYLHPFPQKIDSNIFQHRARIFYWENTICMIWQLF